MAPVAANTRRGIHFFRRVTFVTILQINRRPVVQRFRLNAAEVPSMSALRHASLNVDHPAMITTGLAPTAEPGWKM